jgi:RNA polymerase sigma factor (TIGR02999 family)
MSVQVGECRLADRHTGAQFLGAAGGDEAALDCLTPLIYDHLRRIAHRHMRNERQGNTLVTTAMVNEAYLRLAGLTELNWQDRAHFFAVAAQMMRRILVGAARARNRQKRGAERIVHHSSPADLDNFPDPRSDRGAELIALDDALDELAGIDARKARVIELRYFGGMSVEDSAEVLQVSPQTVLRDWKLAKAWLKMRLSG